MLISCSSERPLRNETDLPGVGGVSEVWAYDPTQIRALGVNMPYKRYGGGNGQRVDGTRREIVGSVTSGSAGTYTDETITLPNLPDQSFGLRIHEMSVEWILDANDFDGDLDIRCAILSTQSGTAEKFLSDPEVICKIKEETAVVTAIGEYVMDAIKKAVLYPPRIVMGTQFHFLSMRTHAAATVHYRIVYSLVKLTMQEALATLTTMQF